METHTTLTSILRRCLRDADSLLGVANATGVQRASLIRFRDGRQSLRLEFADALIAHFGVKITAPPKRRAKKGGA